MSDNVKAGIVIGLDVAVWALAAWLFLAPKDSVSRARMYWHIAQGCQSCATWFGCRAIEAELRYYQEVT